MKSHKSWSLVKGNGDPKAETDAHGQAKEPQGELKSAAQPEQWLVPWGDPLWRHPPPHPPSLPWAPLFSISSASSALGLEFAVKFGMPALHYTDPFLGDDPMALGLG